MPAHRASVKDHPPMSTPYLYAHSHYSFLRGLPSPQELAQTAARLSVPALALADRDRLSGAIEFYEACQQAGVQPLLGLETQVTLPDGPPGRGERLVFLAADLRGWGSLCRLASLAAAPEGRIAWGALEENRHGLLCLCGGERSQLVTWIQNGQAELVGRALDRLAELFPQQLYLGLTVPGSEDTLVLNEALAQLAEKRRLPLAAVHRTDYLQPEQEALQRMVSAIRLNQPLAQLPASACAPPGAHFLPPAELQRRMQSFPAALANNQEIADRCRWELPLGQAHFPRLEQIPGFLDGESADQVLRRRAWEGARQLYRPLTPEIEGRLEHELQVIEQLGYAALFLIVEEILRFARRQGIPTASRGSAACSLVAHCLGITSPDPVRLNLYFERFLNPARQTPPDIDTDICSRRRDEVIRFVYERFGPERVAMVGTINRFRRRSALREVAKALGLPPAQVSALAAELPHRWYGPPGEAQEHPYAELLERYRDPRHQQLFAQAAALIGLPDHLSVHPGGMVIAPGLLTDLVPTQPAPKGVLITQFDLEAIERLGLVKIDLLGIRGLTVLGEAAARLCTPAIQSDRLAAARQALEFLDQLPTQDETTAELLRQGRTIGCFQIESPGMRATLREIQARTPDDLMAALALYRPGPLTGGLKGAFVRRHKGLEAPSHLHPALQPLLAETYGVILYQEQVLRLAHELAGLSLADSDLLRRAMSHFDPGKQMETLKAKFLQGAAERHGVPPALGERIWEMMAAFAGYGFPKAHAASYAQVSWRSAWLKAHHPAPFMAAVLANWGGYYSQRVYLTEARRLGLRLAPPHINYALPEFSLQEVDGQAVLYMGLDQVRDLTRRTQQRILQGRPFHSLEDFLVRADPHPQEAENLVRAGALEGLGTIPGLLRRLAGGSRRFGQYALFPAADEAEPEDWPLSEKVAAQEAILGLSVIAHPLELLAEQIAAAGAVSTLEAATRPGERLRVAGMRQTWRRSLTRLGDYIYWMALEDLEGMLEVLIRAPVYRRCRLALRDAGPYLVDGTIEIDPQTNEAILQAEKIERL